MMLPHCIPQQMKDSGPGMVEIHTAQGPGSVEVTGPGGAPVHGVVTVPTSGPPSNQVHVPIPGAIFLHYKKGEGAPDDIEVDVTVS